MKSGSCKNFWGCFGKNSCSSCNPVIQAVTVLGLIWFLTGCQPSSRSNYELDDKTFSPKFLRMVEERTGISLPKGCRGLNLLYRGAQTDPSFRAKIEIPSSSE